MDDELYEACAAQVPQVRVRGSIIRVNGSGGGSEVHGIRIEGVSGSCLAWTRPES